MSYVFWNFFISKQDYIRISVSYRGKIRFEPSGFEHKSSSSPYNTSSVVPDGLRFAYHVYRILTLVRFIRGVMATSCGQTKVLHFQKPFLYVAFL